MKHKSLIFGVLALLISNALYSGDYVPQFDGIAIKLSAEPGKVGAIYLSPSGKSLEAGELWVRTVLFSRINRPGAELGQAKLLPEGMVLAYGSAGDDPEAHFKIYCFKKVTKETGYQEETTLSCSEYLTFVSEKHNILPAIGPAGPDAPYEPLNMKQ